MGLVNTWMSDFLWTGKTSQTWPTAKLNSTFHPYGGSKSSTDLSG